MTIEKITIVDNEFYTAWCFPTKRLIQHQFHQYCYGDDFRTNLIKAAEAFENYNCIKWLSDDRKHGTLHQDDWAWGEIHFTPRIIKAGWKYYAMVLAPKVIAAMRQASLVEYFKSKGVTAEMFTELKEAEKWLDSKSTISVPSPGLSL
jgi:hypothetical protein